MNVVVLSESAVADLESIETWYASQGAPDVGRRLIEEIIGCIESLTEHAQIGRMVPEFGLPQIREIVHPPFRIVYRLFTAQPTDEIQVLRVWRTERLLQLPQSGEWKN